VGVKEQTQTIQIQGTEEIAAEVKPFPPSYLLKLNENFTFPGYTAYSILGAYYFCDQKVRLQKMDFEIIFENTRKSRALHPLSPISAPGVGNSFCCLVHQQITNTFVRLKQ